MKQKPVEYISKVHILEEEDDSQNEHGAAESPGDAEEELIISVADEPGEKADWM
jgi:hypothetical protein